MATFTDLKNFLVEQNLQNRCVCSSNTLCSYLEDKITSRGVQEQKDYMLRFLTDKNDYFLVWWILYETEVDQFRLKVSFFNGQEEEVDASQFKPIRYKQRNQHPMNYSLTDNSIRWVRTFSNQYSMVYNGESATGPLAKTLLSIIKVI